MRLRRQPPRRRPHSIDNPARKAARPGCQSRETLAAAERDFAALLTSPACHAAAKNASYPGRREENRRRPPPLGTAKHARDPIPAKLPANQVDPRRRWRCCGPAGAACRWCCGCWRQRRGLARRTGSTPTCATTTNTAPPPATFSTPAGLIAYTPETVTVTLDTPPRPALCRPFACSSTNSPPPRRGSPATRGPSPTRSPRARQCL